MGCLAMIAFSILASLVLTLLATPCCASRGGTVQPFSSSATSKARSMD
jgi:hypothetical protein